MVKHLSKAHHRAVHYLALLKWRRQEDRGKATQNKLSDKGFKYKNVSSVKNVIANTTSALIKSDLKNIFNNPPAVTFERLFFKNSEFDSLIRLETL